MKPTRHAQPRRGGADGRDSARSARRRSRAALEASIATCVVALAALSGCRSYERAPLDLEAVHEAWMKRSPGDASVRAFADALGDTEAARRAAGGGQRVFDPADGLSLAEAEAVALVFNAELRVARLEAGVSRASAEHAGLWEDPVIGADLQRIISGAGGASNAWVVGSTLGLTIPISGRLEAEKARARVEHSADLERIIAKEWATRIALRERWIEWSAARARVEVTLELADRLREVVVLAEKQEKAGSMSRIDARIFSIELAGRSVDLAAEIARAKALEKDVLATMGLPPSSAVMLTPALTHDFRRDIFADPFAQMTERNPDLAAAKAEYEVAEAALAAEVRKQYPDVTIGPGYGSEQGDDRVLLGVTLPIPLWNRNQQGVTAAEARRAAARERVAAAYERLGAALTAADEAWNTAHGVRLLIETSLAPLADEQEADVRKVAALGRVEPLLMLESLRTLHAAKVRLIDAHAAESIAAVRVESLLGPHVKPKAGTESR